MLSMGTSGTIPSVNDRRAYCRAELRVPCVVDAGSCWLQARCCNVSACGIAVQSETPLAVGTVADLYFELPSAIGIDARAEVVRVEGDIIALRFLDLPRESVIAIRAWARATRLRERSELLVS
jgi:hypothetical protein